MSPVDSRETASTGRVCYLPHHGVMKSVDGRMKLRVVFNGSSPLPSSTTLNNGLRVGPNLLPALPDILTRWRLHKYAMGTDIKRCTAKFSYIRRIAIYSESYGDATQQN